MPITAGYYCDKNDVYDLTNLDELALSIRQVEKIIGMAQGEIEATLKAAGFPTEDWIDNDTTPLKVQILCSKLASGYALRSQYTGESPNDTKQGSKWVRDARAQLENIVSGDEAIIGDGEVVEPDTDLSGETLKTTDTKAVFTLDDNPDMGEKVSGGVYQEEDDDST